MEGRDSSRSKGVALWKLALGYCGIVFAIYLADRSPEWTALTVIAVGVAVFNYAAWRWGRDSRGRFGSTWGTSVGEPRRWLRP